MALLNVVSILWFIIVPKIKRVWSGEKIIMSKLLEPSSRLRKSEATAAFTSPKGNVPARFGAEGSTAVPSSSPNAATSLEAKANVGNVVHVHAPIVLNIEDPPPQRIESQILSLKDLISDFMDKR
jgi:hypothetical protein